MFLFEKMSDKLSNFESLNLCESEEKQLLNMNIPIFFNASVKAESFNFHTIVSLSLMSTSLIRE